MNKLKKPTLSLKWLAFPSGLALALVAVLLVHAFGGTINGTVTDPGGGTPPPGTVVKLFKPGLDTVFGQANVDPGTGNFSLGPVAGGVYILKAIPPEASGLTQSLPAPVSVLGGPVNGLAISLTDPQITGTVMAPDGVTPANAIVKVMLANGAIIQSVSAPSGVFAVGGLVPGGYNLRAFPAADDPFWKSDPIPVSISPSGPSLLLTPILTAAQLWGTAKDQQGNPVHNAVVHVVNRNTPPHHRQSDHTSSSGFWAIGGLQPGDYRIVAQPPFNRRDLTPPEPVDVNVPGGINNPYNLVFGSAPKVVKGKVTINSGDPVDQALVVARRVDKHGRAETLTAADGTYELRLSPGLWALTVKETDLSNPAHWIFPKPPQLVHFQHNLEPEMKTQNFKVITADSLVVGIVEMPGGGAPPFSVTVALRNSEGLGKQVDIMPDGSFSARVPHGGYKVVVHPHDPGFLGPVIEPIRVEPDSTFDLGTLTLVAKDATITGTVLDGQGSGVEGIPVTAWRAGTPDTLHTRTGPNGNYILPVVAGRWHVQPAPGPAQPYLYLGDGQTVTVGMGQVAADVDFELIAANATINGQLVDESGAAITDVNGWAKAVQVGNPVVHNGAPIRDGAFSIQVPRGEYNVAAHLLAGAPYMSGSTRNVTVNAGETVDVTIEVLPKNATIAGVLWDRRQQEVVTGVDGVVGAYAQGNWAGTHINPDNGGYRFNVAAGLWHLGYRIDPDSNYVKLIEKKNVPVQAGQTAEVPLPVVLKDGAIAGQVLAPNGDPLGGVPVIAEGIGPVVQNVTLKTLSRPDGTFRLPAPHGVYRLGALRGRPGWIKPVEREVVVRPGQVSDGHVLQFQLPDVTISGALSITTNGLNGQVLVWAWSNDGGFTQGRFPVINSTGSYALPVTSNALWHVGAVFETDNQFWATRERIPVGNNDVVLNLQLTGPRPKPAPVVVTFDAADPQRIDLPDGTHIFIPAGAMPVDGEVTLRIVPIATLPHQRHANVYKYGYAFLASDSVGQPIEAHFDQDVIIRFSYDDAELINLGLHEAHLKPAYFSTTTDHWTFPESYVVDADNNTVTMQIDHFTDFALTAGDSATEVYLPMIRK